jgi:large conductance mechanosensitive channel
MWNDFKTFIARGNVMDLAIGIIIGSAFGQVVSTLVNNIVMPPIGLFLGRVDFSSLYINLSPHRYASLTAAQAAGAPVIAYGLFINTLIDFFIVAAVVFLAVRWINSLQRPKPAAAATTKTCPYCVSVIALQASRCPACTSQLDPA